MIETNDKKQLLLNYTKVIDNIAFLPDIVSNFWSEQKIFKLNINLSLRKNIDFTNWQKLNTVSIKSLKKHNSYNCYYDDSDNANLYQLKTVLTKQNIQSMCWELHIKISAFLRLLAMETHDKQLRGYYLMYLILYYAYFNILINYSFNKKLKLYFFSFKRLYFFYLKKYTTQDCIKTVFTQYKNLSEKHINEAEMKEKTFWLQITKNFVNDNEIEFFHFYKNMNIQIGDKKNKEAKIPRSTRIPTNPNAV
jgi:hypothetical protein